MLSVERPKKGRRKAEREWVGERAEFSTQRLIEAKREREKHAPPSRNGLRDYTEAELLAALNALQRPSSAGNCRRPSLRERKGVPLPELVLERASSVPEYRCVVGHVLVVGVFVVVPRRSEKGPFAV